MQLKQKQPLLRMAVPLHLVHRVQRPHHWLLPGLLAVPTPLALPATRTLTAWCTI